MASTSLPSGARQRTRIRGDRSRRRCRACRETNRSRPVSGSGASARRDRTSRACTRLFWTPPSSRAMAWPTRRFRTSDSPLTRNSSGSTYHGPRDRRPAWTRLRIRLGIFRIDLTVVAGEDRLAVEQEVRERRIAAPAGPGLPARSASSRPENPRRSGTTRGPSACAAPGMRSVERSRSPSRRVPIQAFRLVYWVAGVEKASDAARRQANRGVRRSVVQQHTAVFGRESVFVEIVHDPAAREHDVRNLAYQLVQLSRFEEIVPGTRDDKPRGSSRSRIAAPAW